MEENNKFKITLDDGTVLENLRLNGNNYISTEELTENDFEGKLSEVTIQDDSGKETVLEDVVLIQVQQYGNEWWFILAEKSPEQKEKEKLLADIEAQAEAIQELAEIIGGAE